MSAERRDYRPRMFISHQWADKHVADRIQRDLAQVADVWIDIHNLRPGRSIDEQIDAALAEMDGMLLLWSPHSARSEGVRKEIEAAAQLGLIVYPVILEHDEAGWPVPALPSPLDGVLRFDLHHYGLTSARIAAEIVRRQADEHLPESARREIFESERGVLVGALQGEASVLQYINSGGAGQRDYWVQKLSERMAEHLVRGAAPEDLAADLSTLDRQPASSSDERILLDALRRALAGVRDARRPSGAEGSPPPVAPDILRQRLGLILLPDQVEPAAQALEAYIAAAPQVLVALARAATRRGSAAGAAVVAALRDYLDHANDLIPDHLGTFGLVDDAWLVNNVAYRLVEAGLIDAPEIPADLSAIVQADAVARAVIPPEALHALNGMLVRLLQLVVAEISTYQPATVPFGRGYQLWPAGGGTWEDRINAGLLGTGLSVG